MSTKTNTKIQTKKQVSETLKQAGLILMTVAATAGLVEMPEQFEKKALLAQSPAYAFAGERQGSDLNAQRRERDEAGPHYISYGVSQRTPGRTGRL